MPRRARYLVPRGLPRRDEILAVCVVLAIGVHLLVAQLTMVFAVLFYLVTKVTRWRLSWLAIPAAAGLAWAAAGPRAAVAGYTAGAARVAGYLGDSGHQAEHLMHFTAAFAGLGTWLPRQLPLALLAGAAEAALAGWLSWLHTDEWELRPARPGLIVAARRAATARAIRAGDVAAGGGGCLGIASGSGARITLSWAEAAGSVSVCGSAASDVLTTGFQLVHAAIRRHKPVIAVDHTADPALAAELAAVCAAAGAPLLVFGPGPEAPAACYEPFRHGSPARRAALITAMLSWDGPGRQYRRSCLSYLDDVFELLDAAPGDPRVPVLDDVLHLLNPVALQARMEYVPAGHPRRQVLAERIRVSAHLISAEPATIAGPARQLRELRESSFGRWLRPSSDGRRPEEVSLDDRRPEKISPDDRRPERISSDGRRPAGVSPGSQAADIDLGRALADRAVVLFRLGGPPAAESSAMLDRLICQDLLRAGATRDGTPEGDTRTDGLIWLAECAALPRQAVTSLIARGRPAGLPVLAATTSAPVAADLADLVNVVIAHRMADGAAAPWVANSAAAPWVASSAASARL